MSFDSFPVVALLPKKETLALKFLSKYGNFDGRGIKIAVFDSGVDPGAAGLQVTSDGKPKIIDIMNASGDGDVDTSTIVKLDPTTNTITGLTGRVLKIPSEWNNPTCEFHIGVKNGYELYPKSARERVLKTYKEKHWSTHHQKAKAEAIRELQEYEKNETKNGKSSSTKSSKSLKTLIESEKKEELKSRVEVLDTLEAKYSDLGPVYDVVVFHDGVMWRACLDTTETGDLEKCQLLGPYNQTFKYGTISEQDKLNYAINVYEEGNILEISRASSDHGTHVASIIASYFPDEPEKNGIAPGAQLISVTISDARNTENMETGSALMRACIKALESKVDIINMSFSDEYASSSGRILDMMSQVVDKYGVIFVSSTANDGPGISTVKSSTVRSSIFGIGAYVSPDMMVAGYSLWHKLPGRALTFSSKDPNLNGGLSVAFCAPGAALASVPQSSLTKANYYNGTSMSSPNAAGCIALILSGLKKNNLPYTPYSVRRAIENTALKTSNYDPLVMGAGLIQVEPAFDYCVKFCDAVERDVQFKITTNGREGIYLCQEVEVLGPTLHTVTIEPRFINHSDYSASDKLKFDMNFNLVSNEPWVECPSYLHLNASYRQISIKIDPTGLPLGLHFTKILAFDSSNSEKGVMFSIPVTVIKPIIIGACKTFEVTDLQFGPGSMQNWFFTPPRYSSVALISVSNNTLTPSGILYLAVRQLIPQSWGVHKASRFTLNAEAKTTFPVKINDTKTVAVTFSKWWSGLTEGNFAIRISFEGSRPSPLTNIMLSSQGIHRLEIYPSSNYEDIYPKVSFSRLIVPLRPVEYKIFPLGSRDITSEGAQIFQLILTYNFTLPKTAEVTVSCPLLSKYLYDSPYESQLWLLFNSNKQFMLGGDAFPSKHKTLAKLDKGDYVVKLQVRHENMTLLEKLTETCIHLNQKLHSTIFLNEFSHYKEAMVDGKKYSLIKMPSNQHIVCYFTSISNDKLPKDVFSPVGSFLSGTLTLSRDESKRLVEAYTFNYLIDAETPKKLTVKKEEEKQIEEQFKDALIDFKINWLAKFSGTASDTLYTEMRTLECDKKLPILFARIKALENEQEKSKHNEEIINIADEILSHFNRNELMGLLAIAKSKKKNGNEESKEEIKSLEKEIEKMVEALCKKGIAIVNLIEENEDTADSSTTSRWTLDEVYDIYSQLSTLIDLNDSRVYSFMFKYFMINKYFARALKLALREQEGKQNLDLDRLIINLCRRLHWTFGEAHFSRSLYVKQPPDYRLF